MKMRTLLWLAVPVLAGTAAYLATSPNWLRVWRAPVPRDPVLEYPAKLDLGERETGEEVVVSFTIANRGGDVLVIDDIHTNCSCTGMEQIVDGHYSRIESLRLNASEEAHLVMRISVRGSPAGGRMVNAVEFHSNDPQRPDGRIDAVISRVSRGVSLAPSSVIFGTVPVGRPVQYVLDIRDTAVPPRSIEEVTSTNSERVSVRLLTDIKDPVKAVSLGEGLLIGQIEVVVDTRNPGPVHETVQVRLAKEARAPDAVAVMGKVAAPVEISPSLLMLPRVSTAGPLFDATCICRSTNGEPLTVSVDSAPDGLKAEVLDGSRPQEHTIRVVWDPSKGIAPARGEFRIIRFRAKAGKDEAALELRLLLQGPGT